VIDIVRGLGLSQKVAGYIYKKILNNYHCGDTIKTRRMEVA
jgi:hypothetical protein